LLIEPYGVAQSECNTMVWGQQTTIGQVLHALVAVAGDLIETNKINRFILTDLLLLELEFVRYGFQQDLALNKATKHFGTDWVKQVVFIDMSTAERMQLHKLQASASLIVGILHDEHHWACTIASLICQSLYSWSLCLFI
jgi:hypothetical protein